MKIITNDGIYVQKNDIVCLNHTDLPVPASIFTKVFGKGIVIINDSNRYEFVKFEDKEDIEFFKNLDWIVNYDELKDLSEEEMIKLVQSINEEKNKIAQKYNSMSQEERSNNSDMVSQCELLDFKIYSVRDVLWFKQGSLKMELPKGVAYPADFVHEKKGIKKLVKTIFNKNKK